LHLGNERGDLDEVRRMLGDEWLRVCNTCERTMRLFPRSLYAGVDVAVLPNLREHVVLEVNAFGDLLPGVTCDGKDTYGAEIDCVAGTLW
ncbi:MAG: hypothetical protein MI757_05530, partial [Pirellulales bacterium]|nr:hypothetical protein [Pirellulales bacterium]